MSSSFTVVFVGDIDPNVISVARARGFKLSHFPSWQGFNLDGIEDYIVMYNAVGIGCPPALRLPQDQMRWHQMVGTPEKLNADLAVMFRLFDMFAPKPAAKQEAPVSKLSKPQPRVFLIGPHDSGIGLVGDTLVTALRKYNWSYGYYHPNITYSERIPMPNIVLAGCDFWVHHNMRKLVLPGDVVVYQPSGDDQPAPVVPYDQLYSVRDMKRFGFSKVLQLLMQRGIAPEERDVMYASVMCERDVLREQCARGEQDRRELEARLNNVRLAALAEGVASAKKLDEFAAKEMSSLREKVRSLVDQMSELTVRYEASTSTISTLRCENAELRCMPTSMFDLNELRDAAHANSREKGFWDNCMLGAPPPPGMIRAHVTDLGLNTDAVALTIPEKLALLHSEISEALEVYRDPQSMSLRGLWFHSHYGPTDDPTNEDGSLRKPIGFMSEMADVVIRVFDLTGAIGGDLASAVKTKMAYNRGRPRKHGKAC